MKSLARAIWRGMMGIRTLAFLPFTRKKEIRIFYAGARAGDKGGPLVKVRLLSKKFPEHRLGFSILYQLSNAIYLPRYALNAIKRAGVPIILNQNGVFYPAWHKNWEQENARMAHVHHLADHVLYQSEFCKRCAEKFLGPRKGASQILYNGVDIDHFTPAPHKNRSEKFNILTTGKIGASTLYRLKAEIEGIAQARKGGLDVSLTIAGKIENSIAAQIHQLIEKLSLTPHVIFKGPFTAEQAPHIYQQANAYILLKANDPCPNVILEALASGLPILYSASGGVPELVGDAGIGLPIEETFEENLTPTPQAVAEAITRIILKEAEFSARARQRAVERFALQDWLTAHERLFEERIKH